MECDGLQLSVVDWAIDHPESIAVFERYGIDYCCVGKSLEYACQQQGVDPQQVLAEISQRQRA
jgi:regulator of cell morphogenesis and NO signaling